MMTSAAPADAAVKSAGDVRSPTANALSFAACCRMLEAVEKTPKSDAKLRLVFSSALRDELGSANGGDSDSSDMYPLLRLLLPQLDRERTYNLKEKKIARVYIDVLGMATASKDAQKLEHFNDPTIVQTKAVGDFAAVLYDVLVYRSAVGRDAHAHTVGAVNDLLDALAAADSTAARRRVFMRLATEFSAQEQKWLVRLVLKDLKIGLRHERVLQFLHPDAVEMYNHTNDLHRVCTSLRNSAVRYVPQLAPFQVFSPMLAKRVDFGSCTTAIGTGAFAIEPKLDGERITCHVQADRIEFISRNGTNYTDLYGPCVAPFVKTQLLQGVDCILDGEMMVWDNLTYCFREFGLLKGVAHAQRTGNIDRNGHRWLCFVVWDVVYVANRNADNPVATTLLRNVYRGPGDVTAVMGLPFAVRRALLLRLLTPLAHRVLIIEQTIVDMPSLKDRHDAVMAEVDKQVASGGEGVILKDLQAHYMCGETSRKTGRWLKLKPDYAGMTTNLDVIIVGGQYGTGRRRSGDVSVFLLGVLARSMDDAAAAEAMAPGAPCPVVYTFARVGTGYNLEELDALRRELEPHWQPWDDANVPSFLNGWRPQSSGVRPDVWIDPRHSKVLEVYGFELTFSTLYQTGLTIRFPRCKAIRDDKPWHQCMSVQDLNAVRGSGAFNANKRAADVALGQRRTKRKPKGGSGPSMQRSTTGGIVAAFSQAKLDAVALQRNVFDGLEVCVLPGKYERPAIVATPTDSSASESQAQAPPPRSPSTLSTATSPSRFMDKQQVETLLHSFGATLVQNPMVESTAYVLAASDAGFKVANLVKQGRFDIVSLRWVAASIAAVRMLPLTARDFVFATAATHARLAKDYDAFGDHFTEHVTPTDLRLVFREVARASQRSGITEPVALKHWQTRLTELAAEEQEAMDCALTCLAHCIVYVDQFESMRSIVGDSEDPSSEDVSGKHAPIHAMKLLAQQVQLCGGTVVQTIDATVTHVVIASRSDRVRLAQLQPIVRTMRRLHSIEPATVTARWVAECMRQREQLPVTEFFVAV